MNGDVPEGLTPFQAEVARAFFAQPQSRGFRLAGGAALLALRLSRRMSNDLDLFTSGGNLGAAHQALVAEAVRRGWTVSEVSVGPTFRRLVVRGSPGDEVLVDLAVDGRPLRPSVETPIGTSYDAEELAAQKTLALFGRATERDFVDVYVLARRFGRELLLTRAAEIDSGFDVRVFASMIALVSRFTDDELPTDEPTALREFYRDWAESLRDED